MAISSQLGFRFSEVPTVTLTVNFFEMTFRIVVSSQYKIAEHYLLKAASFKHRV